MTRPILARFDAAALRQNFAVARRHAGAGRLWAVVKANGYGHGLERVVEALAGVADGFALIELEAAIALRQAGLRLPLLMMEGFYDETELARFAEYSLIPVLHRLDQVEALARAGLPVRLPVYLKLETGMHRLGLESDDLERALALLETTRCAESVTLMSHFADADGPAGVGGPLERFRQLQAGRALPVCLANSAALLRYPETRGDWARPGIMLYGSSPFPEIPAAKLGLAPVMTLESRLIAVREIVAGDHVGYGNSFTAPAAMRIGVVAAGYGDGYPRHAGTGTPVLVNGLRTRTLGRVSMDKLCVDLTDLPGGAVGSPVTLWGRGLPADEVAAAAGTISYELFCAVARRVPFVAV